MTFNNMTFHNCNGVAYFANSGGKTISQCVIKNSYEKRAFHRVDLVQCVVENLSCSSTFRGALLDNTQANNCHISKIFCQSLLESPQMSRCIVDNLSCAQIANYNRDMFCNLFTNLCLTATSNTKLWSFPRNRIINNTFHIAKTSQTSQIAFNNSWNTSDPLKRIVANNIIIGNVKMTTAPSSVYSNNYCQTITQGSGSTVPISCIQGNTDPMFKNQLSGDFHLLPDSPFAHKGTSQFLSATNTALDGHRFNTQHPSMGCYEVNYPTIPSLPSKTSPFGFELSS